MAMSLRQAQGPQWSKLKYNLAVGEPVEPLVNVPP
jgi:hypothetical protein